MAIFRKIHTSFWSDSFTSELDKDKKLFYLYLLTNERTKQCGVYEITKRQIAFDLGYTIDTVSKLLEYFIKKGKIRYNESTNELAIGNWLKYNNSTSPKVKSCIDKEFKLIKDTLLIQYINSIDTDTQEEEEEEEQEEEQDLKTVFSFEEFWILYPTKKGKAESEKKYDKIKEKDRLIIKQTIKSFLDNKPFKDYTHPNPLTYINQKRWLDNVDEEKKEIPLFEFDFQKHGGDMNLFHKQKAEHERKYS